MPNPTLNIATETMLWAKHADATDAFEEYFRDAQGLVTLNGDAPFTTVDTNDVIQLANDALNGDVPDDGGA